jgi:hypothetical protein
MSYFDQLLAYADSYAATGGIAADLARFDGAGLVVELVPLPFTPVGPILTTPALAGSLVAAVLERREGEARQALVKAEGLGDLEGVAWLKSLTRALRRTQDYLARATHAGSALAMQLPAGAWVIVGSQGARYRVERSGMHLSCDCPHGSRVEAGEAAAGTCWHKCLVEGIEEAQDERDGLFGQAAA